MTWVLGMLVGCHCSQLSKWAELGHVYVHTHQASLVAQW